MSKITVIIADDIKETRENIKTLLSFDDDIKVVGEASNGNEAIELCRALQPDIILMDINMPLMDGIQATEEISAYFPDIAVVIMSVQGENEYLKRAMAAGAREFLIKPFNADDLINGIHETFDKQRERKNIENRVKSERIKTKFISVYSTRGGVGKTTCAVNLAASLSYNSKTSVIVVDFDLQFGDVSLFLNKIPQKSIIDILEDSSEIDFSILKDYIISFSENFAILPSPKKPEQSEYITQDLVRKLLDTLKDNYHYVIIDTTTGFNDITLTALDYSDIILYVATLDIASIKNLKLGLDLLTSLDYQEDKIKIVVNKANEQYGIKYKDVIDTINREVDVWLPEDNKVVIPSLNKGVPFMISRGSSKISKGIKKMNSIISDENKKKRLPLLSH